MSVHTKIATTGFFLWGLIHVIGGGAILFALLSGSDAAFAIYRTGAGSYPALAGAILGYFAYGLLGVGLAVSVLALTRIRANSAAGLALATALVGVTEVGLLIFLLVPGHVSLFEALPGMLLFAIATVSGGLACNTEHRHV